MTCMKRNVDCNDTLGFENDKNIVGEHFVCVPQENLETTHPHRTSITDGSTPLMALTGPKRFSPPVTKGTPRSTQKYHASLKRTVPNSPKAIAI